MGADKISSRRIWRLQQDEHGFQHTSPTHYPSWPSPRSYWSATGPRNNKQPSEPKLTNTDNGNLHGLLPVLHRSDRWTELVRPVATAAAQQVFQRGSVTSLGPGIETPPKTQPARKENPTQSLAKQLQTDQELTSSTPTQEHTSQAVRPRQIPQVAYTSQTGHTHRSDWSSLGSSG
jgi:hypothetical protein